MGPPLTSRGSSCGEVVHQKTPVFVVWCFLTKTETKDPWKTYCTMFLVNWTAVFRAKVDENLQQLVLQVVIYDDDRASKIVVIWFCSGRDPTKKKTGNIFTKKETIFSKPSLRVLVVSQEYPWRWNVEFNTFFSKSWVRWRFSCFFHKPTLSRFLTGLLPSGCSVDHWNHGIGHVGKQLVSKDQSADGSAPAAICSMDQGHSTWDF